MRSCVEWKKLKNQNGYGIVNIEGRQLLAHRVAYQLYVGTIAKGLRICHHCDNPPCIEPTHLFQGTGSDNALDSVKKGRWGDRRQFGTKNGRAVLTTEQVEFLRKEYDGSYGCIARLARENQLDWNTVKRAVKGISWARLATTI